MTSSTESTEDEGRSDLIARYGQVIDDDISESERAERLVDLLIDLFGKAGAVGRRARPSAAAQPAVLLVLDGTTYLIEVTWFDGPATAAQVDGLRNATSRNGVRLAVLSMSGFTAAAVRHLAADNAEGTVLLDRSHVEAVLCGLATLAATIGEAAYRAMFADTPYSDLAALLMDTDGPRTPPGFVSADRLPAPWDLLVSAAPAVRLRHVLNSHDRWPEPIGFAVTDSARALITISEGIVEVDLRRGTTEWLLQLRGCRGAPLIRADGAVLTLCNDGVIEWKDDVLTPLAGSLSDGRALLVGPNSQAWVLSGYGPSYGAASGSLALTRLSSVGRQIRHRVHFDADVRAAGWLGEQRFFLAAAGHSAVLDLTRSSAVRRGDWIETPHLSPDHIVVGPRGVITASPDGRGVHATLYHTDIDTKTSEIIAEVASNQVHGLAVAANGSLLLLGDVRGNDVTQPRPVLIDIQAIPAAFLNSGRRPPQHPTPRQRGIAGAGLPTDLSTTTAPRERIAIDADPVDRYNAVRVAAEGSRKDYALDPRPIASGGQATVFGAMHKPTNSRVAFKRINSRNRNDLARMRREIEAAQLFGGHPNIMPVLDFSSAYDWFVMPLAGDSAQTMTAELSDPTLLRRLVTAVCSALQEPHQVGWIHRDLKPENILQLNQQWLVADWGLGRRPRGHTTDPHRTQAGGRFGTEGFAAPELSIDAHDVGPQADIYSIGQIIGWALTGKWPLANVPLLPPTGPWRNIVNAATRPQPSERPETVDSFLALLTHELDN